MGAGFYRIWSSWCDTSAGTTTGVSTSDAIWVDWTAGTAATTLTTAGTANTESIWITWTTAGAATGDLVISHAPPASVDLRTPAQRVADDARYEAQLAAELQQRAATEATRRAASAKARALLLRMLDVHQREQLERDRFFEVIARHSKRRYRIRQGTHGNVRLLDAAVKEVTRYCGQPIGVPTEDCMLAQKLQIEHDEEGFLRAANASRVA